MVQFTRAQHRYLVRITGGCGFMTPQDAHGLYDLYADAFRGDFKGAFLFGGTQMRRKDTPDTVIPSITEVVPCIRRRCPNTVALGVVPRIEIDGNIQHLQLVRTGILVYDEPGEEYYTQIHPEQDMCVVVQGSADQGVMWDAEMLFARKAAQLLSQGAGWKQLLISYNGGGVTEKEILQWAQLGWPVLLINGSGRTTEKYANDAQFLSDHPNVHVVERTSASIRTKLIELGAIA